MNVGIISDTHGMLKSEVVKALENADCILHAGDVGDPAVLRVLQNIAPTHCVRGNTDGGAWAKALPFSDMVDLGGRVFYLVHDLSTMDVDPVAAGVEVIVSGHTHRWEMRHDRGILYFNPGSASYGRHGSPASLGWVAISDDSVRPRIITLGG